MSALRTALIGRVQELDRIVAAIRTDQSVVVVGEAGIGKTTLVRAAGAVAGRAIHEGGGFATLAGRPYLAISRALGHQVTGDPASVAAQVERVVGPDLLFVDDLQWTDPATRQVVGLLVDRILIVACVRDGDSGSAAAVQMLQERGVTVVRVLGLSDSDAMALARRARPEAAEVRLKRVVDLAGGNPLLIEELVGGGQAPSSLERAILGQIDDLSEEERAVLELLAIAGRPIPTGAIGAASARLVARDLVREVADGLAVRHGLIAEAIAAMVPDERCVVLHARLATIVRDPGDRAHHLAAGGDRAAAFAVAQQALATATDPRMIAELLAIAAETSEDDPSRWRVKAARQLHAIGRPAEAIALLREYAVDGSDDVRALAAATLAGSLDHEGENDQAWAVIDACRDLRPGPGSEGALALAIVESVVLVNRGRLHDALAVAELAAAGPVDPGTRYRLDGHLAAVRLYAGQTADLDPLTRAIDAAIAAGDGGTAAGRAMDLYYMALALRGAAAARTIAFDLAGRLDAIGYQTRATELRAESAQASILAGDLAATVVLVDSMLEEPLGLLSRQRLLYNRGLALGLLGRIDDAERTFVEVEPIASQSFDGRGAVLWCWAEVALWSGRPLRAHELAEASLAYTAFNDAEYVLPSLLRAWTQVEVGQEPALDIVTAPFPGLQGAPHELRGLRALSTGRSSDAVAAFDEAAALWAGFHAPREHICRWAAGEALRQAGDAAAIPRLRSALDGASSIGFEPLAARARRSLRLAGERPPTAARATRAGELLTGREREILVLVARGLTNAEIARRMSLGRPTVARILSNAMLKLGAENRAHAVALAERID